jgi:Cu-Zn family superoxide dismutase
MPRRPPVRPPSRPLLAALAVVAASACHDPSTLAAPEPGTVLAAKGGAKGEAKEGKEGKEGGGLPAAYVLPGTRVYPEGIAVDERRQRVYVTSTTSGAIFYGDLRDGTLTDSIPGGGARTTAAGIDVGAEGQLFVAGGATGRVFVLSATGATLATLQAAPGGNTFVNDVAVVRGDTAYVTDSRNPVIYRVYQGTSGYVVESWLPLAGTPIGYEAGFNLNGIAASANGKTLYVVQSNTGELFSIDVATRRVAQIDLGGGAVTSGDGLEVQGNRLTVLRNQQKLLVEIRLRDGGTSGEIVAETTDPSFRFPTTFVEARGRYLVVNSQFDARTAGRPPVLPFTVSVVKAH